MALPATIYQIQADLSDVDRQVYESLDLRVALHPSETMRYMLTRVLAYCLSYEEGIAFSKGGLSSTDEPPLSIYDPTGARTAWIDIGNPSAERLHKATKATERVCLYTHVPLALLQKEAAARAIHRMETIQVWRVDASFLDALEALVERKTKLEIVRSESQLYVTCGMDVVEGTLEQCSLVGT